MPRRRIPGRAITLAVTAIGLSLMSGPSGAQDKITLTFANWAAAEGATRPGIEKVIRDFEAAHPDITIKSEAISFSEIAQQLVLRVNSGNPPDVAEIAGNDTFLLAATGKLEPLDGYVTAELKESINPSALNGLMSQGKLVAFPWTEAASGFWYNKEIMRKAGLDPEKPPRTIEELMAAMAAIRQSQPDVIPLGLDTTNRPFGLTSNWPWMLAFGARPLGESADAGSAEMKRYLEWMREMARKNYIDPGRKIGEFRPLMAQGKVAFTWDQVLLKGVIQSANGMPDEEFYNTFGVTTQPAGPSGQSFAFDGGHQLVLFADSPHKEAAWTFIQYLATDPTAIREYTIGYESSLPPLAKAEGELAELLDTPVFNAFTREIAPTIAPQPYGPAFAAASTAIMAAVQEAVTGTQPIDEIITSMQQRLARGR